MRALSHILERFAKPVALGPDVVDERQLAALRGHLEALSRSNDVYFKLCVAMTVGLFGAAATAVAVQPWADEHAAILIGALLMCTCGAIVLMRSLWREKVASDLLIGIVDAFEGEAVRTLVDVCLRRLSR